MKQRSDSGKRSAQQLSESLHHLLNSYALAASAAGVSLLALAQPSEAEIVYTPAHKSITPNHTIPLDLNHDRTADFRFKDIHFTTTYGSDHRGVLSVVGARPSGRIQGYTRYNRHYASALSAGELIGPKGPFTAGPKLMASVYSHTTARRYSASVCDGPWANAVNRYLGLKFLIRGKAHFGWARLNVNCPQTNVNAELTGYAYETIPNKPIIAGKTKGKDVITVQPASLGHLARGASAIPTWRTKESQ